jgi:hypothetical protein
MRAQYESSRELPPELVMLLAHVLRQPQPFRRRNSAWQHRPRCDVLTYADIYSPQWDFQHSSQEPILFAEIDIG